MGNVIVLTGASGVGKTAVAEAMMRMTLKNKKRVIKGITCTTRDMRAGEVDGIHYNFLSEETFHQAVFAGDFIETFEYAGNHYGTRYKDLSALLDNDENVVIVMEINGAMKIKEAFPDFTKIIYLERPFEELVMAILERDVPNRDKVKRITQILEDVKVRDMKCVDHIIFNETGKLHETAEKIYKLLPY